MSTPIMLGLAGLLTLLPAALMPFSTIGSALPVPEDGSLHPRPGIAFWLLLTVSTLGPVAFQIARFQAGWLSDFGSSLWATVAVTMVSFVFLAGMTRHGWRLTALLLPYLMLLGLLGTVWAAAAVPAETTPVPSAWLWLHIAIAVVTYALLTLAAVAAMAVWLRERAIRRRSQQRWIDTLPAVTDAERLLRRLLLLAEIVLGFGIVTGMATQIYSSGTMLEFDHKTLLTIAAFVFIGILMIACYRFGIRGQRAARYVLLSWLLLTLAYPGVKFVTDVLLS